MACSHKRKEPIVQWVVPRKPRKHRIVMVSQDVYELIHCPSCNAVAVCTRNEYVYRCEPFAGSLSYSFERRGRRSP